MRKIVSILFTLIYLYGYEYNTFLLNLEANIYPKIILFDTYFPKKIKDKKIHFFIIYENVDKIVVNKIIKRMRKNTKKIKEYDFYIEAKKFDEILENEDILKKAEALFILKGEEEHMIRLADLIQNRYIYSFVYDIADLEYGFLMGINLEKEVVIYVNKEVLIQGRFKLIDQFFSMVRFVE